MVIVSDQRERGNLLFTALYEIASVVLLPRNDIMTQPHRGGGKRVTCNRNLFFITPILRYSNFFKIRIPKCEPIPNPCAGMLLHSSFATVLSLSVPGHLSMCRRPV